MQSGAKTKRTADQATLDIVAQSEHERCLICGASNPFGLKLRFRVADDRSVVGLFPCKEGLQSYPETLHGGVISALLDAAMTNALFAIGIVAVTAELSIRFLAPVVLNHGAVVRATVEETSYHPLYNLRAELEQDREIRARATAKFLVRGCFGPSHDQ